MIHLGYLTYHEDEGTVRIPNEEVRIEFNKSLRSSGINQKWVEMIKTSQQLLEDTIAGDEEAVVKAIEVVRETEYAPTYYNDEQALRYVIKYAYMACVGQYAKVEDMPSGRGIADVVYIPKKRSHLPALIIELKWSKTSDAAISQIRDRKYPTVLQDYGGEIVLVGINYDEKSKKHSCVIEKIGCTIRSS